MAKNIYNDKSLKVMANRNETLEKKTTNKPKSEEISFTKNELINLFAAYITPVFDFIPQESGVIGTCKVCGAKTSKAERILCGDCMTLYAKELHDKSNEMGGENVAVCKRV